MDWVTWIIPLIALVVWILANLLRVPQENNRPAPRPRPRAPGGQPGGSGEQHPMTDLDRFIREAKRRKQQQEEKRAQRRPGPPPLPTARPTSARTTSPPTPRPEPAHAERRSFPQPKPRPAPPPRTPPAPPQSREVPGPRKADRKDDDVILAVEVPQTQQPVMPTGPVLKGVSLGSGVSASARSYVPASPLAREVMQMLNNQNSTRVAFVLREILDRPVSQRPRR